MAFATELDRPPSAILCGSLSVLGGYSFRIDLTAEVGEGFAEERGED